MSAVTSSSSAAHSSSKAGTAGSSSASSGSVTKRLRSELMSLMMAGIPGVSAFPESDSDLTKWLGTIKGPEGTPYSGLSFKVSISFPQDYPLSAPTIKFLTPCFHPNVALPGGDICLDILKEEWSSIYTIQTILISLQSLLGEPNNNSPLNVDASQLWGNEEAFKAQVQRAYKA